jgi:hypothetical protein
MNRKIMPLCMCFIFMALWIQPGAISAEEKSIDCTVTPYNGSLFADLYKSSEDTAQALCSEIMWWKSGQIRAGSANIRPILKDFAEKAQNTLDEKNVINAGDYKSQFDALRGTFEKFDIIKARVPEFIVKTAMISGVEGYFEPLEDEQTGRFQIEEVELCKTISPDSSCRSIFEDFASAFNPYRSVYDRVYDNTDRLAELGREWDTFLEVSKSQTFLEVWLTTWFNRKHFKRNKLVGPPEFQVIALHPQLVYDRMSKAPDGSNQELGLAVEWIGINFWDLKVPLGISLASIHVDRPVEKEAGHGAMLHFYNKYGIGWARHGDKDSFYITIDLLKMLERKKETYDRYFRSYL